MEADSLRQDDARESEEGDLRGARESEEGDMRDAVLASLQTARVEETSEANPGDDLDADIRDAVLSNGRTDLNAATLEARAMLQLGPASVPAPLLQEAEAADVITLAVCHTCVADYCQWDQECIDEHRQRLDLVAAQYLEPEIETKGKDPRVSDSLLHVRIGVQTFPGNKQTVNSLVDGGAKLDAMSVALALSLVPDRTKWIKLDQPRMVGGVNSVFPVQHYLLLTLHFTDTSGHKTSGSDYLEQKRGFYIITDGTIPLILGKPWLEDREKDSNLVINYTHNYMVFSNPNAAKPVIVAGNTAPLTHWPATAQIAMVDTMASVFGDNWKLHSSIFDTLREREKKDGRGDFTRDCCCEKQMDGSTNHQDVAKYCVKGETDGRTFPLAGDNSFLNVPFAEADVWVASVLLRLFIALFLGRGAKGTPALASILMARWTYIPCWDLLTNPKYFETSRTWKRGDDLFSAGAAEAGGGRRILRGAPWPVSLFRSRVGLSLSDLTPELEERLLGMLPDDSLRGELERDLLNARATATEGHALPPMPSPPTARMGGASVLAIASTPMAMVHCKSCDARYSGCSQCCTDLDHEWYHSNGSGSGSSDSSSSHDPSHVSTSEPALPTSSSESTPTKERSPQQATPPPDLVPGDALYSCMFDTTVLTAPRFSRPCKWCSTSNVSTRATDHHPDTCPTERFRPHTEVDALGVTHTVQPDIVVGGSVSPEARAGWLDEPSSPTYS
jgi:hypothetical protein